MRAKLLQSNQTLCDPMDCSPPGSFVYGIIQARTLEWVALPSSRGSSKPGDRTLPPHVPWLAGRFFITSATWEAPKKKWKVKVKVTQWCLTFCDSMDCIVHGILQATILEWAALPQRTLLHAGATPQVCAEVSKESRLRSSLPMEWINWLK